MNPEPPRARISVTGPDGLIAVVPHLLGFHPDRSLVITGAAAPRQRVSLVLRYDLPDPPEHQLSAEIAAHATRILRRQQITTAAIIGYGPGHLVTPAADHARQQLADAGIAVADVLRVHDGRYWSYLCTSLDCCPPDGQLAPSAHPAAAALDATGISAAASGEPTDLDAHQQANAQVLAGLTTTPS